MAVERKFVKEAVHRMLIKDFVQKETERAGFGGLDIQRTPLGTRVNIVAERPGMVIGRRGVTINELTANLGAKFGMENPQISVEEPADNPALNAQIMATKVAESLERGWHFRRVGHSTVQRIMGSGAMGVIVEIAGKLTGQRKRREKFIAGHIKYCGETAYELMDTGYAQCKKKLGIIGCTVRIMKKDAVLPDHVKIYGPGEREREEAQRAARVAAKAAGVEQVQEGRREGREGERRGERREEGTGDRRPAGERSQTGSTPESDAAASGTQSQPDAEGAPAEPAESADGTRRARKSFTVGDEK